MAEFKPIKCLSSKLDNITKKEGQFIVTTDTKKIYLDIDNYTRIEFYEENEDDLPFLYQLKYTTISNSEVAILNINDEINLQNGQSLRDSFNSIGRNSIVTLEMRGRGFKNIQNFDSMFGDFYPAIFSNLAKLIIKFNTNNMTTCVRMFNGCSNLNIPVPNFNTSLVTNMAHMFQGCKKIKNIPNFNTNNVTNLSGTFRNCFNLHDFPQWNTIKVTNVSQMFMGCNNLVSSQNMSNIINMLLNSQVPNSYKNITNTNTKSPFFGTNFKTSVLTVNEISKLSSAGWNY